MQQKPINAIRNKKSNIDEKELNISFQNTKDIISINYNDF